MITDIQLRELRRNKGYKQAYVSLCTGIPQSTLSRFENGKLSPTLHELELISTCLGVKLFLNMATEV